MSTTEKAKLPKIIRNNKIIRMIIMIMLIMIIVIRITMIMIVVVVVVLILTIIITLFVYCKQLPPKLKTYLAAAYTIKTYTIIIKTKA